MKTIFDTLRQSVTDDRRRVPARDETLRITYQREYSPSKSIVRSPGLALDEGDFGDCRDDESCDGRRVGPPQRYQVRGGAPGELGVPAGDVLRELDVGPGMEEEGLGGAQLQAGIQVRADPPAESLEPGWQIPGGSVNSAGDFVVKGPVEFHHVVGARGEVLKEGALAHPGRGHDRVDLQRAQ